MCCRFAAKVHLVKDMQFFRPTTSFHLSGKLAIAWLLLVVSSAGSTARADEPFEQFISGLRERGYYDTALTYLDDLSKRQGVPKAFADLIDLELGMTYRALGVASRVPEDRDQALSKAEEYLKKFAAEHADNPRAAFANAELGQLLFDRARSLIWDAEAPGNADKKKQLQDQARTIIDTAKKIYQAAFDQYDAQYKTFPKFIDEKEDPEGYRIRFEAQVKYLRAHYNLVRCTYERGQTFDMGTKERNETLIQASKEFEAIHQAYRKSPIGLQSRLMMGKCFQEQNDINRALGIYNEMLGYDTTNPTVRQLASIALQYRLICLNTEERADYQLVIQEAGTWLANKDNRSQQYSETGLGILWEKAIAEEKLAKDRTLEAVQKNAILRQALADAKQVGRFTGPYKESALALSRRINAELGEKDAEPRDFDTAFERAKGMVSQIKDLDEAKGKAKTPDERQKAQQALNVHYNEIGRLFELALSLRDENTTPAAVAQARYLLSYVFMRQRKSFDAFILARYCMTHDKVNNPDIALDATEIAIASAVQAYIDAPDGDKTFELDLVKGICEQIVSEYPQSAKGNEARMRLGQVYRDLDEPEQAAEVYLSVPKDYSEFPSAQISAGQSYWAAHANAVSKMVATNDTSVETAAKVAEFKDKAKDLLTAGLKAAREKIGEAAPTDEMTAAEVSLVTILNQDGQFDQTIQRLTANGENSVLAAIEVPEGEARPESGILSAPFAGQTYRALLRAYVGTQNIDQALVAMGKLEGIGGQDITAVYTQLGKELQDELERLKSAGDTERLAQVRTSFEQFLEKVYAQRNKTDYNSLLWIGETYFGLGQGVKEDVAAAATYYGRATDAYQEMLDNNLADGGRAVAIKLRLVRCKRAQGAYEEAISLAQSILAENEASLDVQAEAAHVLADWGADPNGVPAQLLTSIDGLEDANGKKSIWGWSGITRRLAMRQTSPEWADLKDTFLEARYELTNSRLRYAKTGAAEAAGQLEKAMGEVTVFVQVYPDLDDVWFSRFDQLYQDIQAQQGKSPIALQRPEKLEIPPEELVAQPEEQETKPEETATTAVPTEPEGSNTLLISLAVALAAGGGFAFYKIMSKPAKRVRTAYAPAGGSFTPPAGAGGFEASSSGTGADGMPDFSGITATAPAKPAAALATAPVRKKTASPKPGSPAAGSAAPTAARPAATRPAATRPATSDKPTAAAPPAGGASADPAAAPVKKKRLLTPEEAARYRAAKAAKLKAQAAAAAAAGDPSAQPRKVVKRSPSAEAPPADGTVQGQPVKKKIVKKRPPQPPAE